MKRLAALVIVTFTAFSANANCLLHSYHTSEGAKLLNSKGWNFANHKTVCEKLRQANAAVQVISNHAVLGNQSIGWASVMLRDKDTNLMAIEFLSTSTRTNSYASEDKARELMWEAMNDALNDWDRLDNAIEDLKKERNKIAKLTGRKLQ